MFFVLSKTIGYLTQPIVIVSGLLILSLLLKKTVWKKRTFIAGVSLLFFFSNEFIANEAMRQWELPAKEFNELKKYEVAILLTGITVSESSGPNDRVYFYLGADRLIHTVQLFKLGIVKKVVISGGSGKLIDDGSRESLKLKSVMLMMGVPDSVIYTDASSDNTYENAVESKRIIDSLKIPTESCLLVTSAFHMRRSLACFRKVDLDIDYFTCDFRSHSRSFNFDALIVPKLDAILIWQKLLKEWAGFAAYKVAGYI